MDLLAAHALILLKVSAYLHLYNSLVRSQLNYAVPIWNPLYDKYIKERVFVHKKNYALSKISVAKIKIHTKTYYYNTII